ncbi:ATP-binding protein [Paraburkholderia sp. J12]|uniref:ATP-binding protein n=1 Tax=Paraburkholderia sp. J12 TaxID=2805432 RepID=UPI002ABD4CD4|nr:ATP-binding protein [Paraburkholderia sp. J12]
MIRLLPRSLLGRNLLLLVLVVIASEVSVILLIFVFIQKPRIDEAALFVASQTAAVERLLAALPEPGRSRELAAMNGGTASAPPVLSHTALPHAYTIRRFLRSLRERLPAGTALYWEASGGRRIWVRLVIDDRFYWLALPTAAAIRQSLPLSAVGILLTLAMFPALGAWLIQRHTAAPLQRLASAAMLIERGTWPEPVPAKGPTELAKVAEAFNRMVEALAGVEATRAEMLAGISHDIRTPLTKLRMAIAAPESFDAPLASAERFVAEIDTIVAQFIDFARGWDDEPRVPGDLNGLVEQLAADYAGLGHAFELKLAPLPLVPYRAVGMQRLLMNLMHNAAVHGRVGLAVRTYRDGDFVTVCIEDEGPGVPAELLSTIRQPFRRVATPGRAAGTGLGLAIAERIARQHEGRLDLALRPGGGFVATVRIPCD